MNSFSLSFSIISPLFLWMAAGYLCARVFGLKEEWSTLSNKVIFYALLPFLLMRNVVQSGLSSIGVELLGLIGFTTALLVCSTLSLMLIIPRIEKEDRRRGSLIQGSMRSNTALFGIPVVLSLYGEGNIALATMLVAAMIPLYNIACILVLERYRGGKPDWGVALKNIITNPLILGLMAGMVISALSITLPGPVKSALWGLADCATPFSFFVLGASFSFKSAAGNIRAISLAVSIKLLILPLICMSAAVLCGYRGQGLAGILVLTAPPTAVSSYPMACAMGADGQLSSEIVVFTSAVSLLTMFAFIFVLHSMGLL